MNRVFLSGVVGSIRRQKNSLWIRLAHRDVYYSKKREQTEYDESWFSITMFGFTGDSAEKNLKVGMHICIEGTLSEFPKGPGGQARITASQYHIMQRKDHLEALRMIDEDRGPNRDDETVYDNEEGVAGEASDVPMGEF